MSEHLQAAAAGGLKHQLIVAVFSFLLGGGLTGVAAWGNMVARVAVLEDRHANVASDVHEIKTDLRAIRDKLEKR